MKKIVTTIVIVFILAVFLMGFVNAKLGLVPGKLYFNLNPGEQDCQKVMLISQNYQGIVKARDVWTDKENEYRLVNYDKKAKDLGISISYPKQIDNFNAQQEFEVCLIASKSGKFTGDLIFTPTSNTNIVVEVGTWLFVNVSGEVQPETTTQTQNTQTSTGTTQEETMTATTSPEQTQTQTTQTDTASTTNSPITGSAIGGGGSKLTNIVIYFVAGLLIAGALVFIIKRWRGKRWERGL